VQLHRDSLVDAPTKSGSLGFDHQKSFRQIYAQYGSKNGDVLNVAKASYDHITKVVVGMLGHMLIGAPLPKFLLL
jgi:hypothetical protein